MQSQISNIMKDLVQNPSETMPYQVQAISQRRWLIEADPGPIVQLELLDDGRSALIYATTARRQRSAALVLHNDADAGGHDRQCPGAIRRLFGRGNNHGL